MATLSTPSQVFDALGGPTAIGRLLSDRLQASYTAQRVHNWKGMGHIPDRRTFPILYRALRDLGFTADPTIWGYSHADFDNIVETAAALSDFYKGPGDESFSAQSDPGRGTNTPRFRKRDVRCARSIYERDRQMPLHL